MPVYFGTHAFTESAALGDRRDPAFCHELLQKVASGLLPKHADILSYLSLF